MNIQKSIDKEDFGRKEPLGVDSIKSLFINCKYCFHSFCDTFYKKYTLLLYLFPQD
ncbi:MAG: hypothetical protein JJU02_12470 [Cryomorphaceae bacterium]|nr:hypothetical protein [Cryomorphaceae bacterium]